MYRTTQDELDTLIISETAQDITNWPTHQIDALIKTHRLKMIEESHSFWGIDGALFEDETGALYAITDRTGALYRLLWEVWFPNQLKPRGWTGPWRRW